MVSVAIGRRLLTRRWIMAKRARMVIASVAALAVLFILLALYLGRDAGTPLDVAVTRLVQGIQLPLFGQAMYLVSAFGFTPVSQVVFALSIGGFWLAGFRHEAWFVLFSLGAGLLSGLVKLLAARPRPNADLVRVTGELLDYSFPSGHVTSYVSLFGFLFFLFYVLFKGCWWRNLALVAFGALVLLVGVSRIYLGHHWFSDVVGGYALGAAYLLLLIELYTFTDPKTKRPPEALAHPPDRGTLPHQR